MTAVAQRVGRLLGRRPPALQVGALCLRPGPAGADVLLITSRGTRRWIIPKGWPMRGKSLTEAAAQEAWEEAGVSKADAIAAAGRYAYDKQRDSGFAMDVDVHVFAFQGVTLADTWPEQHERQRRWFPAPAAAALVAEPGLQRLLRQHG